MISPLKDGRPVVGMFMVLLAFLLPATSCLSQTAAQRKSVTPSTNVATPPAPKMPEVGGTTIDRVVAVVNGDLVLDSDVNQELRFEALQPFRTPNRSSVFEG